jgi:hypothetical protein
LKSKKIVFCGGNSDQAGFLGPGVEADPLDVGVGRGDEDDVHGKVVLGPI